MSDATVSPIEDRPVVLEVKHVTKRFPGIVANADVNLTLHKGEILALLGENGAGKSTLMNIIYGLYHQDEGIVRLLGREVKFASPREAIHSGIGMVHQHFQLIPVMTVAENVLLGEEASVSEQAKYTAPEETPFAGTVRLVWGAFIRILIPIVAAAIGLLIGYIVFLTVMSISTYLVNAPAFNRPSFNRLPLIDRATAVLAAYYPEHTTLTSILLALPLLIGALVGAACLVLFYRNARRTWRGRQLKTEHKSQIDGVIDALIDLVGTIAATINQQRAAARVRDISRQFNLEVDPDAYVEKLPVGAQQRVEIVKALYRKADILILDEPTAVLTPQESQELFKIMKSLSAQGVSIIFITHKLREVLEVADSIVVMRGGKVVGSATPQSSTQESLAAMMVGREVMLRISKTPAVPAEKVLSVVNLSANDDRGNMSLVNVSFDVYAGEVLGIAGVQGNGQTELVEVLTGLRKAKNGQFTINDQSATSDNPRQINLRGVSHVPEDRHRFGLVKPMTVTDNLVLNRYFRAPFSAPPALKEIPLALILWGIVFAVVIWGSVALWSGLWPTLRDSLGLVNLSARDNVPQYLIVLALHLGYALLVFAIAIFITNLIIGRIAGILWARGKRGGLIQDDGATRSHAQQLVQEFDIRTPSIEVNGGNLSGGNQQKLVVAREFSRHPKLLIAAQPTRGIDVGSIEFIHNRTIQERDNGAAVLLVSAELDEIMALSDRIAVMYKGQIMDIVAADTSTREQLGLLMAGVMPTSTVASSA